jgi:hypothetical protein
MNNIKYQVIFVNNMPILQRGAIRGELFFPVDKTKGIPLGKIKVYDSRVEALYEVRKQLKTLLNHMRLAASMFPTDKAVRKALESTRLEIKNLRR